MCLLVSSCSRVKDIAVLNGPIAYHPSMHRDAWPPNEPPLPELPVLVRPSVLKYIRDLQGVTRAITDRNSLLAHNTASRTAGLGNAADRYLESHGFTASAKMQISHAYRNNVDINGFISEVCSLGMSAAEAEWLFSIINRHDTY